MNLKFLNDYDLWNGGLLVILCGPPGSGKTTIANQIKNGFDNFVIVSPDNIRKEVTGDINDQTQNKLVFSKVYSSLTKNLENGYNVVYDATNCRSVYRYKIMDICKDYLDHAVCIVSTTSMASCLKQNAERDRVVPEDVIEKMYFTLRKHPPTIFEGYDIIVGV